MSPTDPHSKRKAATAVLRTFEAIVGTPRPKDPHSKRKAATEERDGALLRPRIWWALEGVYGGVSMYGSRAEAKRARSHHASLYAGPAEFVRAVDQRQFDAQLACRAMVEKGLDEEDAAAVRDVILRGRL